MSRCPACSADTDGTSRFCPSCGASMAMQPTPTVSPATPFVPLSDAERQTRSGRAHVGDGRFLPGALLHGRYRIVSLLGRGGMGEVYRADDTKLGQTVALKFLPESLARDDDALQRFFSEVRIGRQVSHPNVCRLYELIEVDGHHCLAMEYVDGEDLASLLKRIGRLPVDKAIDISREICAGLAAAHDKGVIHRDLKPANIMIDSKGRVRITDFGLAAFAEDTGDQTFAGTPAYMAPEQMAGHPASIRSDIFALGLVLHEIFTGKRVFEARTLAEFKDLHEHFQPLSLTSSVRDIPPAVEQTVLSCLAKDADARPQSVYAVIAALPGGDPLQAALAAGETPSPAMVAAAGKVGDLGAGAAWGLLAAGIAGMILVAYLAASTTVIGKLRPDKSPEVLTEKARDVLTRIGYADKPSDSASWFWFDQVYLKFTAHQDPSGARPEHRAQPRPGPLIFVHRQSPRPLVALRTADLMALPAEVGRLGLDDPPMDVGGMTRLILDQRGDVIEFLAVPPQLNVAAATTAFDWPVLLSAAGFDPGELTSVLPRWAAPVDSDQKLAWDGAYPGQANVPFHIEAAAFRGKPVWFAVQGPWVQPRTPEVPVAVRLALWTVLAFGIFMLVGLVVLSRRNLRSGRGDRRGGMVLARLILISLSLALLIRADHVSSVMDESRLVVTILSQALYFAVVTWMLYVSFEPYARRRWPTLMISWSRLLAGRVRDPMVGRDVLIGGVVGVAMMLVIHLDVLLPTGLGHTQRAPLAQVITPLSSARHLLFFFLINIYSAMGVALASLIGVFVFRAFLRVQWLALLLQLGISYLFFVVATGADEAWSPAVLLLTAIWFLLLMRVGLLAASAATYFFFLTWYTPLTLDPGAWYAGRTLIGLGILAGVLLCAFHVALAGKSWIGASLLERDENL